MYKRQTYVVGSKLIADAANSGDTVTIVKGGAVSGVNEGVTIIVDKNVDGVTKMCIRDRNCPGRQRCAITGAWSVIL